jgi:glycosyltransferase involved in cell wall biosynthesis
VILGIDASNLRTGGSVTHLRNVLAAAEPRNHGFKKIIVWGNRATLDQILDKDWLEKIHDPILNRSLPHRLYWQQFRLPNWARARCDILLSPGGNAPRGFAPLVSMSRNMLPFEPQERRRYGFSWMGLRLLLLRFGQARTFQRAHGVIFLARHARDVVSKIARIRGRIAVVPHGVEERFRCAPRPQRSIAECSLEKPLRLIYVSIIDLYKHQWVVAEAVATLRKAGMPIVIDFVGPAYPPALRRLNAAIAQFDPKAEFLRYRGPIPFEEMHALNDQVDIFVFASSCENMPNILLEGMASGFPIASSRCGPMEEILGDAGVYFDPTDAESIADALRALAVDTDLRASCAEAAYARAKEYSWERCARETFDFLERVACSSSRD